MYDRPTAAELIDATRQHLEKHLVPLTRQQDRKVYFQTLVAVNVLKVVERELALRDQHITAEWARLDDLQGAVSRPISPDSIDSALAARNQQLCKNIRAGQYDTDSALFEHLKATARAQLEVANPRFLAALDAEDSA